MIKRLGWPVILLGLSVALLVTAYLLINTTFMIYDDEGYLLISYKNFIAGGRLYDEIFTQYGPWPYVYHLGINLVLQTPITHMVGRNLTIIHWALCSILAGAIAARLTGKKINGLFTTLVVFGLLWPMSCEPSHPGSMICVLLAGGGLLIVHSHAGKRWNFLGTVIGVIAGLLVLTKINIGIFFLAGAGVAMLKLTAWPKRWQLPCSVVAAVGLMLVPWCLMGGNLRQSWVLILAIQFTLSAAGILWVTPVARTKCEIPQKTWLRSIMAFVGTVAIVTAVVLLRGTSPTALVRAILVSPLHQPSNFVLSLNWPVAIWPIATVCWLITARAGWELRSRGTLARNTRLVLLAIRLITTGVFVYIFKMWPSHSGLSGFTVFCLSLLPVFLVPLQNLGEAKTSSPLCLWAACLALPQVLHAYPVAGSQMSWGTFLLVPVMAVGVHDAWEYLVELMPGTAGWLPRTARCTLFLVGCAQLVLLFDAGWERYQTSKPFDLPGAENVRAGDHARLALRVLTVNAMVHADVLFSRQGMFSYNLWSGVPTPTMQNATHWFWLLDPPAQAGIINGLRQTPRSAIITNQPMDEFLSSIHVPMACPLQSFIEENYQTLFVLEGFHFLVPQNSRAASFGHVEVLYPPQDSGTQAPALLQTNVVLDGKLTSAQLQEIDAPWQVRENYSPQNTRMILQPITAQGYPFGETITLPHATPLRGLFQLSIYASRAPKLGRKNNLVLVGLDANGRSLSESVF